MARAVVPLTQFNSGILGEAMRGRVDFNRYPSAAEEMVNYQPLIQGGMDRRAGTRYVDGVQSSAVKGRLLPFQFSTETSYALEFGASELRVYAGPIAGLTTTHGAILSNDVTNVWNNNTFDSNITGWTDNSSGSASVAHDSSVGSGAMKLAGNAGDNCIAERSLTVASADQSKDHSIKFRVIRGSIKLRIGTSSGDTDITNDREFGEGYHVWTFNPAGNATMYIQFRHDTDFDRWIDDVYILDNEEIDIGHPFTEAQLPDIHYAQQGDVMYLWHPEVAPYKLSRFGHRSWTMERVHWLDGPWLPENVTNITLTPSAASGEITLTASSDLFEDDHVGALWRLRHGGQTSTQSGVTSDNTFTDAIKIQGSGSERNLTINISGFGSATVTLQRSYDGGSTWVDVEEYTSNQNDKTYKDGETAILHYRLGIDSGDYTSGTFAFTLAYDGGETWGWGRIVAVTNPTTATMEVYGTLGRTTATSTWREGAWSTKRGWPRTGAFHDQRLWSAGNQSQPQNLWGGMTGDFENQEPGTDDDSAINYAIAANDGQGIRWLESDDYLIAGTSQMEWIIRNSVDDQAVTPTAIQARKRATDGSNGIQPLSIGGRVIHVGRNGHAIFELLQGPDNEGRISQDMTEISGEVTRTGIMQLAYQRHPHSTIAFVRNDGRMAMLTYQPSQAVGAWWLFETSGFVESVVALNGTSQSDELWMIVRREIAGTEYRFIEYWTSHAEWRETRDQDSALHCDCALSSQVDRPAAALTPAAKTGAAVNFEASASVFIAGHVGRFIRAAGGVAKVTAYVDATNVTCEILFALDNVFTVPDGDWSLDAEFSSVSGLSHLDGQECAVQVDGGIQKNETPSSGSVTLTASRSRAHVGLPFTARYKSLKMAYGGSQGTAFAVEKSLSNLALELMRSYPPKIGSKDSDLIRVKWPFGTTLQGRPNRAMSGEIPDVTMPKNMATDPRLLIVEDTAVASTILMARPIVDTATV